MHHEVDTCRILSGGQRLEKLMSRDGDARNERVILEEAVDTLVHAAGRYPGEF